MKFIINNDKLVIADAKTINSGSINDYLIDVETDDSWNGLTISAKICQEQEGTAIERAVINGKVYIDIDKLRRYTIGFIGYTIEDETKVYQKSTDLKVVPYLKGAGELEVVGEQEVPTPAEWEVYLQEVSNFVDYANDILDDVSNLDIDAEKVGNTTTITITKQDETQKQVQILDGEDGQDYVITQEDYQAIADVVESQIDFIDKNVNDLTYYTLTTQTGSKINLELNSSNYQLTAKLYDKNNNLISTSSTIDLPIESMVVNASYSNGILTLTLQNGNTLDIDISSIVSGLQQEITNQNKLASDLVDDTNQTNKFVTTSEKTTWNNKQDALTFDNTPTANSTNPVTSGGIKTYVDNIVGNIETILETLDIGSGV